jgi:hypothetical protein
MIEEGCRSRRSLKDNSAIAMSTWLFSKRRPVMTVQWCVCAVCPLHQEIGEALVFPGGVDMQKSVCRFLMMVYPPLPSI